LSGGQPENNLIYDPSLSDLHSFANLGDLRISREYNSLLAIPKTY
jgi:hypothetical protein